MPGESRIKVLDYINQAYIKLCSQDSNRFIFYNELDDNMPYPIIHYSASPLPPATGVAGSDRNEDWADDWDNSEMKLLTYDIASNLVDSAAKQIELKIYDNIIAGSGQASETYVVAKARKIANIFTIYNENTANEFPDIYRPLECEGILFNRYQLTKVPFKTLDSSSRRSSPRVTFNSPPNRFDVPYFVEFYFTPPDLTSENSPVIIDLNKWQDTLVKGAVAYYEDLVNGQSEKKIVFEKDDCKNFLDDGNEGSENETPERFSTKYV